MTALINSNSTRIPLADGSVHVIACSPPYWNLRNYENADQLGQEELHDCLAWARGERPCDACYVCQLRKVAGEAWRVLRDDGTFWLNLGDSFASGGRKTPDHHSQKMGKKTADAQSMGSKKAPAGLKDKDMVLIPARVALALQADGWYLRSDIIWAKDNCMPESVNGWRWERHRIKVAKSDRAKNPFQDGAFGKTKQGAGVAARSQREAYYEDGVGSSKYQDCPGCSKCQDYNGYVLRRSAWRPTKSNEYVFLLAKTGRYYCDKYAVTEPYAESSIERVNQPTFDQQAGGEKDYRNGTNQNRSARGTLENLKKSVVFGGAKADGYGSRSYSGNEWLPDPITGRNQWDVWHIEEDEYQQFLYWKAWREAGEEIEDRDVWSLPTSGYAGTHFAVWPPDLVRPMLKASTSEHGVCAVCKAPWARMIHKGFPTNRPDNPNPVLPYAAASHTQGSADSSTTLHMTRTIGNVGWMPTCACGCDEAIPATVLDIFCGSGTTLQVARELGLFGIGLDISFTYLANEARDRLELNTLDAWNKGEGLLTKKAKGKSVPKNQLGLPL